MYAPTFSSLGIPNWLKVSIYPSTLYNRVFIFYVNHFIILYGCMTNPGIPSHSYFESEVFFFFFLNKLSFLKQF